MSIELKRRKLAETKVEGVLFDPGPGPLDESFVHASSHNIV